MVLDDMRDNEGGVTSDTKFRNENLKKLVEANIELPCNLSKPVFSKRRAEDAADEAPAEKSKPVFKKRIINKANNNSNNGGEKILAIAQPNSVLNE
jgi:hypothetical protein